MAEKEYIEREKAIDALTERNLVVHMDSVNDGLVASCHRSAQRIIANLPTADVRHVVTCRECKNYEIDNGWCEYFNVDRVFGDYCSEGVKREE